VAAIMTAHLLLPAIDDERPASMSPTIVQGLLKEALGFQGVVFSDDLGMKGVSAARPLPVAAVDAIVAGTDAVLLCNSTVEEQVLALEAVIHAAEAHQITQKRIDDAMARQLGMKTRFLAPDRGRVPVPVGMVGSAAHQAVARDMAAWL
jgi:beta-N-acetylhexosaminidase